MEPVLRAGIISQLKDAYNATLSGGKKYYGKALLPLFGAVAAAPVIGYEAERLKNGPTNNPGMTQQRSEGISHSPDSTSKTASLVVQNAAQDVAEAIFGTKRAAIETLKKEIAGAKNRSKKTRGFADEGDRKEQVQTGASFQPDYRP